MLLENATQALATLTPEEDAELRRLHFFQQVGALSEQLAELKHHLQERDRRDQIREPDEAVKLIPVPR
jgi:hypothetical protein